MDRLSCDIIISMQSIMFLDQFGEIMGGGQRILCQLVSESRKQWDVTVFLPDGPIVDELRKCGATVYLLPPLNLTCGKKTPMDYLRYFIWSLNAIYKIVKSGSKSDLIYTLSPRQLFIAIIISLFRQIPVIFHQELIFEKGMNAFIMRLLFRFPNIVRVFCASKAILNTIGSLNGRAILLYNYVDPVFLDEQFHDEVKASLKVSDNSIIVGCFGRISPTKGQMVFLREGMELLKENQGYYFLIVGSGGFEDKGVRLEKKIKESIKVSQCSDKWILTGWREDVVALMDVCDVIVVPSLWQEPFGLVAIEGMARGKIVVASRRGGLTEIIEDGVDGFIFEPEMFGELKNLLIKLDKEQVRNIGDKARKKVINLFSYDAFMPRWRAEVAQILQGSNCL